VPAVIQVNSLADIFAPPAGTVTLRSAIQTANTNGQPSNTIELMTPGVYRITLPGGTDDATLAAGATTPDPDANMTGDFDILNTTAPGATTPNTLTIINASGGAVAVDGGGLDRVFDVNPTNANPNATAATFKVTFEGFTIQNGSASPGDMDQGSGGAIRAIGTTSITLDHMVLTNNYATADGGGIAMENLANTPWTLTVISSTITNNHAGDAGGGIETDGSGTVVINSGTVISGNTCVNQGAGIWLDAIEVNNVALSATLSIDGSTISNNTALTGPGGGVGNAGTAQNAANTVTGVTISNSTLQNNFSGAVGGAFANVATGNVQFTNDLIENNVAVMAGGGVGNQGSGATTFTGTTVLNNTSNGTGGGYGDTGATPGALTIQGNSLFKNNVAVANGGGVQSASPTVTVTDSLFQGNLSQGNGGSLFVTGANVSLTNTQISGNVAVNGAGIEDGAAMLTLSQDVVDANHTLGLNGGDVNMPGPGGSGGGIDVPATDAANTLVQINNSLFLNNAANNGPMGNGGAINQAIGNLVVAKSQFTGNVTGNMGGAIDFAGTVLGVSTSTFNSNKAKNGGGALSFAGTGTFAANDFSFLTNDTFFSNLAQGATGAGVTPSGGAILDVAAGDLSLLFDTINGNSAALNGGGLAWTGTGKVSIQDTILAQNLAANAGPDAFVGTGLTITDNGGNLVTNLPAGVGFLPNTLTTPPKLSLLLNNGGNVAGTTTMHQTVQTEALLKGSPAIANGVVSNTSTTDERGFTRPGNGAAKPSIGSFETEFATRPSITFVLGLNGNVYERQIGLNGVPTGGYLPTNPGQVKAIRVGNLGDTGYEVFAIGMDNQVYSETLDVTGAVTSGYVLTQPGQVKTLEVGHDASNKGEIFVIGMDDQVYVQHFDPMGISQGGYDLVQPGHVKSLAIGYDAANHPELFVIGMNNQVYTSKFDAGGESITPYTPVAGGQVQSIQVVEDANNYPVLFALGLDSQVYVQKFDGNGNSISNYVLAAPGHVKSFALGNDGAGNPELFAVGMNSQVYAVNFTANDDPTGGYFLVNPAQVQTISVGHDSNNDPLLFASGLTNNVYSLSFDATGHPVGNYNLTANGFVEGFTVV
jgi:hypothetical protein